MPRNNGNASQRGRARLTDREREKLQALLAEDDDESTDDDNEGDDGAEEFVVFRGSAKAFKEHFGFNAPDTGEDDSSESEDDSEEDKGEPKPKSRGKYFG